MKYDLEATQRRMDANPVGSAPKVNHYSRLTKREQRKLAANEWLGRITADLEAPHAHSA